MPVIGFSALVGKGFGEVDRRVRKRVGGSRLSEGKNLSIDWRFADGRLDRLPEWRLTWSAGLCRACDYGRRAFGDRGQSSDIHHSHCLRDRRRSRRIGPGHEPSHPGGNVTGMTIIAADLAPKRLGLLRELVPNATAFAVLTNPNTPRVGCSRPTCALWRRGWDLNFAFLKQATREESKARSQPLRRTRQIFAGRQRSDLFSASRKARRTGGRRSDPGDLPVSRLYDGWRTDQLRSGHRGCL